MAMTDWGVSKKRLWFILIGAFIAILSGKAEAWQSSSRPLRDKPSIGYPYFKDYLTHTVSVATSPLSWERSTWISGLAVTALVVGIGTNEDKIQQWVQASRSEKSDAVAKIVKPIGDIHYTFPALTLLYGYGLAVEDPQLRSTALVALQSAVVAGAFTEALKHLTHRHRPSSAGLDSSIWDGPSLSKHNLSFPSGHAAHSFAIATVLANQYRDTKIVPVVAYSLALTCSASRINDNQHWATDVIAGALIGHLVAKAIFKSYAVQYQDDQRMRGQIEIEDRSIFFSVRF